MGDQKGISDMSFEEFFSESKKKAERAEDRKAAAQKTYPDKPKGSRGFIGATPKINFNNGKFLLYVPRYEGQENDRFDVAVECGDRVVPMSRLESVKQKGGRVTRPATVDLTPAEVTPMDDFTVTIDGEKAYINKPRPITFYNSVGSPVARPIGEVTAVTRIGAPLKLFKSEILESTVRNGLAVYKVNIQISGNIKVDESGTVVEAEAEAQPEQAAEPAPEEPKKKKPAKRVTVKGEMSLSQPSGDADAVYDGTRYPLYVGKPVASILVTGCDPSECIIRAVGKDGEIMNAPASPQMYIDTGDYVGPVTVTLEKGAKKYSESTYFIVPGMQCQYSGKGDITDDLTVKYSLFGQEGVRDVSQDDAYTFEHDGMKFDIVWCVPYVTYDIGNGSQPFATVDVNVMDLKNDKMVIRVKGARKKTLFFGGITGKKEDVTPGWEGETYEVDLEPIRDKVISTPTSTYCLYLTVNSFPNRKFMTIKNPVRIKAKYEEGNIVAEIDPSVINCVCRLYKIDKSIEEIKIGHDNNIVPVPQDVIEAEVVELYKGQPLKSIRVPVRQLPFLLRDAMGDKWMYVSSTKRIPLPDDLFKDGKPDIPAIRAWHERIVRMNPELKGVTFEMIQKAFNDFA